MLCAKCQVRRATVHHVKIDGDRVEKTDLCEKCAEPVAGAAKAINLSVLLGCLQSGTLMPGAMMKEILGDQSAIQPMLMIWYLRLLQGAKANACRELSC